MVAIFYKKPWRLFGSRGGCLDAVVAFFGGLGDPGLRASVADTYIYMWQDSVTGWSFGQAVCMTGWSFGQASFLCVAGVAYRYVGQDLCGRLKLRSKQFCIVGCDSTVGRRNRPTMELCLQAKVEEGGLSLRGGAWP